MDDSLSNGVDLGIDLNQEPGELLPSYQALIDQLESTQSRIHERIRQLGEVIERAREHRQQARSSRELMYPSVQSFLEITRNVGGEGGDSSRVVDVDVVERNNENEKKYKRNSNQLVERALAMDPEIKKVDKDCGNFYDCNSCLEMAKDPILTCGHLFCWACFYMLPQQDSTSKECPVCMGEVSDNSIVPIYGNGNSCDELKTKSIFKAPPRPKAQRIESGRQLRVTQGLSIPVSEALRRIRTSISAIAIGGRFWEMPTHENSNYIAASQNAQIPQTDSLDHLSHHQDLRVSSDISSSLSDISTALTDAEAQQENQTLNSADIAPSGVSGDAAFQLGENSTNGASSVANRLQLHSSLSSRRRSARLLDADRGSSHQSRRRRLN